MTTTPPDSLDALQQANAASASKPYVTFVDTPSLLIASGGSEGEQTNTTTTLAVHSTLLFTPKRAKVHRIDVYLEINNETPAIVGASVATLDLDSSEVCLGNVASGSSLYVSESLTFRTGVLTVAEHTIEVKFARVSTGDANCRRVRISVYEEGSP